MNISRRAMLIIGVLMVAAIAVGVGYAQGNDQIYACVEDNTGKLRIVDAGVDCGKKEHLLEWDRRGTNGFSGWEIKNSGEQSIGVGGRIDIDVFCSPGKVVLGGGASGEEDIVLASSWPIGTNQWRVIMWNMGASEQTATAFTICADVTP